MFLVPAHWGWRGKNFRGEGEGGNCTLRPKVGLPHLHRWHEISPIFKICMPLVMSGLIQWPSKIWPWIFMAWKSQLTHRPLFNGHTSMNNPFHSIPILPQDMKIWHLFEKKISSFLYFLYQVAIYIELHTDWEWKFDCYSITVLGT